jgi:hypothetical protein
MDEQEDAAQNPPLGVAKHRGMEGSAYNLLAHRVLKALIDHSPSQVAMDEEFLKELDKCGNIVHQFGEILPAATRTRLALPCVESGP